MLNDSDENIGGDDARFMLTVSPNMNRQMAQRMFVETSTRMATPADLAQSAHALRVILSCFFDSTGFAVYMSCAPAVCSSALLLFSAQE